MQVVLEQIFPLGRFHATPWKVFPYDDPHGEWPPSPWRLVRAVLARSFQLDREIPNSADSHAQLRVAMVHAFAASEVSWQLPPSTWRGPGLRQYQPAEFRRVPAGVSEPGMMAYNTTKVVDNFWITSRAADPVVWVFDGADWSSFLLEHLDACLARMTYFGRAESITEISRLPEPQLNVTSLVRLQPRRSGNAVPVLCLKNDATLSQLEATSDSPSVAETNIPPGSRWMYAERPMRPTPKSSQRIKPKLPSVSSMQFAIGSRIAPRYKDTVLITERFRGRAVGCLTRILTGSSKTKLSDMPDEIQEQVLKFSGKGAEGKRAIGHHHVSFFLCGTIESPTRLCAWRKEEFTENEQRAILEAANIPLPLNFKDDPWTLNLVPLDKLVPLAPGLDGTAHAVWKTLTPYIPPLHVYGRNGKEKPGYSVEDQLKKDLAARGINIGDVEISAKKTGWVKVHRTQGGSAGRTNNDKIGYNIQLTFSEPLSGPLSLGASSHFGLGLFVPAL